MAAITWTLGLRNASTGKYLTVEAFGDALNCSGSILRKKQTFTLEATDDGKVTLKSHKGKYLYGDRDGKVGCDADSVSKDCAWEIRPQADGTWALISGNGYFFHGTGTNLSAFLEAKEGVQVPADGKWVAHLAMHPQINLYNARRNRYIHLEEGEFRANEDIPWGDDALLNLVFFPEHPAGRYGLMSCEGTYLQANGQLVAEKNQSCEFLLSLVGTEITLQTESGDYVCCDGALGTLKAKANPNSKERIFEIQDSQPQFTIKDNRGQYISARNGSEIKADQKGDATDKERFQLDVNPDGTVFFYCDTRKYWNIRDDGSVGGDAEAASDDCKFQVDYSLENRVRFVSVKTGKYLFCKPNGAIMATGDGSEETARFTFTIINRPNLLLRGQYGFMGLKGASGRVECNRSTGDIFNLESEDGYYYFKSPSGYWTVDADGVAATSAAPVKFVLEFVTLSKALVKHVETGKYLEGEQNGGLKAKGSSQGVNTLWEY
jgi:fascin 1/2